MHHVQCLCCQRAMSGDNLVTLSIPYYGPSSSLRSALIFAGIHIHNPLLLIGKDRHLKEPEGNLYM